MELSGYFVFKYSYTLNNVIQPSLRHSSHIYN